MPIPLHWQTSCVPCATTSETSSVLALGIQFRLPQKAATPCQTSSPRQLILICTFSVFPINILTFTMRAPIIPVPATGGHGVRAQHFPASHSTRRPFTTMSGCAVHVTVRISRPMHRSAVQSVDMINAPPVTSRSSFVVSNAPINLATPRRLR
jgi:hypothetical protein